MNAKIPLKSQARRDSHGYGKEGEEEAGEESY
jgi:hypothetical protein